MRPLRALVIATCLVVSPAALPPLIAQEGGLLDWNDARSRALVLSAIERRTAQLADTGLTDYTASAHGYVSFLAQLGAGFPLPPVLIKSDELMLEVYWGAPDRSKQRIIGRRDTLLLPTDINYHRDHLGVVQNNFPAIIRLGDGDEVRDVPHPLSAAGLTVYDYRISDSLSIRSGDVVIDVMTVTIRPKDDSQPAAVGAIHIDRVTSSVVRMTFSFTRAALKDRQLEDVSVILENGLVDGRFWLPRRQEIEIRRSATWMDFPARGIIRGRWEICCVRTNTGSLPTFWSGPEIVEVSQAQQRAYPFEGDVLSALPEEVRAFDAADVRRVQEEARALVRSGALARPRSVQLSARGVSDFVRVNRVEGLSLGAGISTGFGAGFTGSLSGRYGTADFRTKGLASLGWQSGRGHRLSVEAFDDFGEAGDVAEVSGVRNSFASQEFGADWTDPFGRTGGAMRVDLTPRGRSRVGLELARENQRPLAIHGTPSNGRYMPTLAASKVELWSIAGEWSRVGTGDPAGRQLSITTRLVGSSARTSASGETSEYVRASFDMEARSAWAGGVILSRTLGTVVTAGSAVPVQAAVFFGGPVSAPGYAFHSLRGSAGLSQRVEYQVRIPFISMSLGRFGRVPSSLRLAPFVQSAVVLDRGTRDSAVYPSVGIGVIGLFDLLRVDVARTLRGSRWMFSVDVVREFWRVL